MVCHQPIQAIHQSDERPMALRTHPTHRFVVKTQQLVQNDSFTSWVEDIVFPIRSDEDAIQSSTLRGIELVQLGGSMIIGDISGTLEAANTVNDSALRSTIFVELFGTGQREEAAVACMSELPKGYGVEPHAPYSCGIDVYREAFLSGRSVATHLAESIEELEYAMNRSGPIAEFLQRIGVWDEYEEPWCAQPIDVLLELAGDKPFVAAHLNYIDDIHIQRLAQSNCTVAYCPRASSYFGHEEHRWQEMIDAGVIVALGTDSLLCLDTPDRISVIDEMRFLYARDSADPVQLFTMATINGAIGLGIDRELVTLNVGETAGLLVFDSVSSDPLMDILNSTTMPIWL